MNIIPTSIDGVVVVETSCLEDQRGTFARLYCDNELKDVIGERRIVQINRSLTRKIGTVRGLHCQTAPHAEMKLVRCLKGRVQDVVVDLRAGSATFLKWYSEELCGDTMRMVVIPEGCAHGFQVLEEDSEMLYLHTNYYAPSADLLVGYNDPLIGIKWAHRQTEMQYSGKEPQLLPEDFKGLYL